MQLTRRAIYRPSKNLTIFIHVCSRSKSNKQFPQSTQRVLLLSVRLLVFHKDEQTANGLVAETFAILVDAL